MSPRAESRGHFTIQQLVNKSNIKLQDGLRQAQPDNSIFRPKLELIAQTIIKASSFCRQASSIQLPSSVFCLPSIPTTPLRF